MKELIKKHLTFDPNGLEFASVKYFAETGKITGSLYAKIYVMLEEAAGTSGKNDTCSNCENLELYENENSTPSNKYICKINECFIPDINEHSCSKHKR